MDNLINQASSQSPLVQMGISYAENQFKKRFELNGVLGKVFNPEVRAYFDVDTNTVKNKMMKLLFPFKTYEFDDQIKKLELYLPIVSLMTLIMFSTLLEGILSQKFTPNIGSRTIWIIIFSTVEVATGKFTENAISNLNIGILEMLSLVSYRFVSLSAVTIILVVTNMSFPVLKYVGIVYALIVDTYYCKLELSNFSRERFKEEGLGNKIALAFHLFTTVAIMWLCNLL